MDNKLTSKEKKVFAKLYEVAMTHLFDGGSEEQLIGKLQDMGLKQAEASALVQEAKTRVDKIKSVTEQMLRVGNIPDAITKLTELGMSEGTATEYLLAVKRQKGDIVHRVSKTATLSRIKGIFWLLCAAALIWLGLSMSGESYQILQHFNLPSSLVGWICVGLGCLAAIYAVAVIFTDREEP
jgi:hypothetical protein